MVFLLVPREMSLDASRAARKEQQPQTTWYRQDLKRFASVGLWVDIRDSSLVTDATTRLAARGPLRRLRLGCWA